jgi:cathepsin C
MQPQVALSEVSAQKRIQLLNPNLAQTSTDDSGKWTMIYDEAFEVNVDGLSFLAFSRFDLDTKNGVKTNVSRCGETQLGWYHSVDRTQWGCYYARRSIPEHEHSRLISFAQTPAAKSPQYDVPLSEEFHRLFAASLNAIQSMWTAKSHERFWGKSLRDMNDMAGIYRTHPISEHRKVAFDADPSFGPMARAHQVSFLQKSSFKGKAGLAFMDEETDVETFPSSWHWNNVSGVSYLDEVLDQGECGSCYAVATTHMLSARHRIRQTDPTIEPFSISFPLYCSEYNQGCNGGYAFLLSRWSQDVGLVPRSCGDYTGSTTGRCSLDCDANRLAKRWRADNHRYVGGYYGAASEQEMISELLRSGPLVASFEPKPDLMYYGGGIYVSIPNQRTEWEKVDHAVLLVGFGEENGQKYWTLQNSWGQDWGEDGFFRMARGSDESGIESIVVAADVVEDTRGSVLLDFAGQRF